MVKHAFLIKLFDMALFIADDNNTRVLFEKVLSSMPKDKARFVVDNLNYLVVKFLWVGCGTELGFCKTITCCCLKILCIFSVMCGENFWSLKPQVVTWPAW